MKEYLLLLLVSIFVAHNVGGAYGELANAVLSEVAIKLEQVQLGRR
jgi:hypothetical protein